MIYAFRVCRVVCLIAWPASCRVAGSRGPRPPKQKDPDYGQKSQDKTKEMYPNLTKGAKK